MVITGTDETSLNVLKDLGENGRLKEISTRYGISLDQTKRLSRFFRMLKGASGQLSEEGISKLQALGLKSLVLAPLFQEEDWEGIEEILSAVSGDVKRDHLKQLIPALQEKRERVREFEQVFQRNKQWINEKEESIRKKQEEIQVLKRRIEESIEFIQGYPEDIRDFLLEYVGLFGERLVLAKRLDSRWQKKLKKEGIVVYDEFEFIYDIKDLDFLVTDYQKRMKRGFRCEWDWDVEAKRSENSRFGLPASEVYRNAKGLALDLRSSVAALEEEAKKLEEERISLEKELQQKKKASPQSFMEAVEARSLFSEQDKKRHGELQHQGMKWLYNKGYSCVEELVLANGKRVDVIGFNEKGQIIILEVKTSRQDFQQDEKWREYLSYCDEFYFLVGNESNIRWKTVDGRNECDVAIHDGKEEAGLLVATKTTVKRSADCLLPCEPKSREDLLFNIARTLTRRVVYGY